MHIIANVLVHCIFVLGDKVHRTPGDQWMIHGSTDYIPMTEIGNTQRRLLTYYAHVHLHISLLTYLWLMASWLAIAKIKTTHTHRADAMVI